MRYEALATLLSYPDGDFADDAEVARSALEVLHPDAAARVTQLALRLADRDAGAIEELYASSFDLNPPATLDVGFHLFGETYQRGAFLVKAREALRAHGLDAAPELPDHLPVLLRLVERMDPAEARDLVQEAILPAVARIGAALDGGNPYRLVLEAVTLVLQRDFGQPRRSAPLPQISVEQEP